MKRFLIFLTCIFFYGNSSFITRNNPIINLSDTPDVIKKIQTDFLVIYKHLNIYKKKIKDAPEMSSEGGTLTGYYDKNTLKRYITLFMAKWEKRKQITTSIIKNPFLYTARKYFTISQCI